MLYLFLHVNNCSNNVLVIYGINNVYHINFRPLEGYCCIEYTPTTWSVNVSLVKQYLMMKTFSANTKKLVFRM